MKVSELEDYLRGIKDTYGDIEILTVNPVGVPQQLTKKYGFYPQKVVISEEINDFFKSVWSEYDGNYVLILEMG